MDKITYSFVKDQKDSLSFQSKVNSFNLDHVVNKDIVSFYASFSKYSYFDTGLLPLDGTGLLGIRTAGGHTQVVYQYKPGLHYINWGEQENDENYKNYYLAQPYRIVIIDFLNDNLLGARTFYAMEPAYHSGINLYHVNLPNINCKGYRGNGVGWICLYHNQDWSKLPFNERLSKALERCSGVEVYNDANMSETDGPRFYQQNNMPDYTYDPLIWEKKSSQEAFDWTLDVSNWIPILVKGRDEQGAHYNNGVQLTLLDAITGNYQAYYYDNLIPKPVNAITRSDLHITSNQVTDWFIRAYNVSDTNFQGIDPYSDSSNIREENSLGFVQNNSSVNDEDDEQEFPFPFDEQSDMVVCPFTLESVPEDECTKNVSCYLNGDLINICSDCVVNQELVFVENTMNYHTLDDAENNLIYDNFKEMWYDPSLFKTDYSKCNNCGSLHLSPWKDPSMFLIWENEEKVGVQLCSNCIENCLPNEHIGSCSGCGSNLPLSSSSWFDSDKIYIQDDGAITCQICNQIKQIINISSNEAPQIFPKDLLFKISQLTEKIKAEKEDLEDGGFDLDDKEPVDLKTFISQFLIPNKPF